MKTYVIEPKTKKSLLEWEVWDKMVNKKRAILVREHGWRWGTFHIYIPETEEEVFEFLENQGYDSLDAYFEDFWSGEGTPTLEGILLPDCDEESIQITEDYDAEMEDCWDGCWQYFYVRGDFTEEEKEEIAEEAEELYNENWSEGVEDAGWIFNDCSFEIVGGVTIKELRDGELIDYC